MALTAEDRAWLAAEPDRIKRRLYLVGALSRGRDLIQPVLVGGCALEFYTAGGYATGDIDLLYFRREELAADLTAAGFERIGRHWVDRDLDLHVEVLATGIEERARPRLVSVEVGGVRAVVIGVEDLLLDRLNGYVYGQSSDDLAWAGELAVLYGDDLDWESLRREATDDGTSGALAEVERIRRDAGAGGSEEGGGPEAP